MSWDIATGEGKHIKIFIYGPAETPELAAQIYNEAAIKFRGSDFVVLNNI